MIFLTKKEQALIVFITLILLIGYVIKQGYIKKELQPLLEFRDHRN